MQHVTHRVQAHAISQKSDKNALHILFAFLCPVYHQYILILAASVLLLIFALSIFH